MIKNMRKVQLVIEEYYHVYNQGVDKRNIFMEAGDYVKFLKGMREFNSESKYEQRIFIKKKARKELSSEASELSSFLASLPKLVDIICYCLNPNHYHFILKQLVEDGIAKFMHKIDLGYTNYFNRKYDRTGALFQGRFKAVHLKTDEYILWISGYVNGNSEIHKIAKAKDYMWCSYLDYLGKRQGTLCNKEIILNQFKDIISYQEFVEGVIKEYQKRKEMQRFILE
jgi:REP element-mobilizing transposase RayT